MSERVHQLIDEIRRKSAVMREQLEAERATNVSLTSEIASLREQLLTGEQRVEEMQGTITELNDRVETLKEQGANSSSASGISNEEIDALVKEIEYCIGQLKR